jgi:uncharacterized protein (TIGR03790 family)
MLQTMVPRRLALSRFRTLAVSGACFAALSLPTPAAAQSPDNILLVINEKRPESVEVGDYYAKVRGLPSDRIVRLAIPDAADAISRPDYEVHIEHPITTFLTRNLLQDRILYIVLTKGVPSRIAGTGGISGTLASVDSELTLLYRRMSGLRDPVIGRFSNPYFLGDKPLSEARRFTRAAFDLYLVTRLDGFTVEDVKGLIDRGARPQPAGRVVLDQRPGITDRAGDAWLTEAAGRLKATSHGDRVLLDSNKGPVATPDPVLGYFSWGSNDPANQRRKLDLKFAHGAIAGMFVGADARTFREPSPEWKPSVAGTLAGSTLAGDLIREGITGMTAHVAEPLLDGTARPQILFPAYLDGFNLAEAFYLATPFLSWQNVVIGDPLCAPFPKAPIEPADIDKGIDKETALPVYFSERRLEVLKSTGFNMEALKLNLRVVSLLAQDRPESEVDELISKIVELEPRLRGFQLRLATEADAAGDYDRAEVMYRSILETDPDNFVALNNLAYLLADKKDNAKEALPLALRAYNLSGQTAIVSDTLGWVHHKLGDHAAALPLIERAIKSAPNADLYVHAAAVTLELGNMAAAKGHLDSALKADPKIAERADVKALIGRIK